jgi:hypothetical protein
MKKSNAPQPLARFMKKTLLIILGVMGAASLTPVQAQLLNVNFYDDSINDAYNGGQNPAPSAMSGAAEIGSAGDVWNGLHGFNYSSYPSGTTYTSGGLFYATGLTAGITVSLYAPSGTYDANSPGFGNYSPFSWTSTANENANTGYPNTPYAPLMATCLLANTTSATGFVTINNLSPGAIYNLYTYNASDENEGAGRTSTFTVNGITQASTYNGSTTTLVYGVDYLEFTNVAASATGTLTIDFGDEINSESDFNGFQLQFVSGPPPPVFPSVTAITINALTLCTNTFLPVTATVPAGNTITSFQVVSTTTPFGSAIATTTTSNYSANSSFISGLGTATATINYPLTTNLNYTVTVSATDNGGHTTSVSGGFDTVSPNLVIEATDFNFSSGGFLDTPANGGVYLYTGAQGNESVDEHKNCSNPSTVVAYRAAGDEVVIQDAGSTTFNEQKFVVAGDPELVIDYTCSDDWFDYTRTYGAGGSAPAGTYDVYLCLGTSGSGPQASLSLIAGDPTTSTQTQTFLGYFGTASFSENAWAGYEYVPLTDQYGNLVSTTISSGEQTLRISQIANPNLAYLILMPVAPKLTPSLSFEYPDGTHPFEPTNHLTFTVNPANGAPIASSGIHLIFNGADVTSTPGFSLTQSGSSWTATYPVQSNEVYTAALNVTNTSGLFTIFPVNFDTFNITNYQWEAVDYDFSTNNGTEWISGLFIDNPVPSCDNVTPTPGNMAANSYYIYPTDFNPGNDPTGNGAIAQQGIDINFGNSGQTYPSSEIYRADGVGSQPASDYVRPKFLAARTQFGDANISPVNIGYYAPGYWLNYTRHWPTNNYYVWGRLASGSPYSGCSFAAVTGGVGTTNQTNNVLGNFSDPNASGYQSWHWIPLLDANGNKVVVSLGGQATFKVTSAALNTEFFMLVNAPPQFDVTPSLVLGQVKLSFPTVAGHTYTVLFSSSLNPQAWSQVGSTIAGDGTVHVVSESPSGTQGYYVVSATP